MSGYFYLARGLFEHPLFKSASPLSEREAWVWLIEQANYEDGLFRHGNQVFLIPRGSLGTRYRHLAEKWHWSPNRVIRVLNLWQTQGMVIVRTEHGYVHLTLCNYDEYQRPWNTDGTATEQPRDGNGSPVDTKQIKEIKGKKETKSKPPSPYTAHFESFWTIYPKNNGSKKEAAESFQRATTKGIPHETIIDGAVRYAAYIALHPDGARYTKHAHRWLNGQLWESEWRISQPARGREVGQSDWKSAEDDIVARRFGTLSGGTAAPARGNFQALRTPEAVREDGQGA